MAHAMAIPAVLPKSIAYDHVVYGRGEIETPRLYDEVLTLVKLSAYAEPIPAENVVQHTVGDTTYVVTETVGFLHEKVLNDAEFWDWMGDDMGIAVVAKTEEPHTGITCEYTGEVIEPQWYQVMWTDSYDEPFLYQATWDGLVGFVHFVIDTHDEENGWMLRMFDVTTGEEQESGDLLYTKRSMAMNHTGDIDTTIAKWTMYEKGDTEREEYFHTWEMGDHDDDNSPINQFLTLLDPEENYGVFDVSGFAAFVREDFSGSFIVSVAPYEG